MEALPLGAWTHPVLTLANEVAVKAFLAGRLSADQIATVIEACLAEGAAPFEELVERAERLVAHCQAKPTFSAL